MTTPDETQNRRKFDDISWKILGWLMDAIAVAGLAFIVNLHLRTTALEMWKAETSGNRWNSQMHADYAAGQAKELTRIWAEMSTMKTEWIKGMNDINVKLAALPASLQMPPKWWEDYVRSQLADHNERLKDLEKRP